MYTISNINEAAAKLAQLKGQIIRINIGVRDLANSWYKNHHRCEWEMFPTEVWNEKEWRQRIEFEVAEAEKQHKGRYLREPDRVYSIEDIVVTDWLHHDLRLYQCQLTLTEQDGYLYVICEDDDEMDEAAYRLTQQEAEKVNSIPDAIRIIQA